jgi:uncharacterized protein YoxC
MKLHDRARGAVVCLVALIVLVGMTGCEDMEARKDLAAAQKTIDELKAKVSVVEEQNKQLLEQLKGVPEKLAAQITERTDKVSEQVLAATKDLLDKVEKGAADTRKAAGDKVETAAGEYGKLLEATKAAIAADVQKIREENKTQLEELKKYMENQLRELYPYAYQPRRESKAPPEPDTKTN